ncbi:MAG: DUF4278 domain-containing protein [Planktothrix sp. GU0601_MAG3]|nr:MAG: DUF4278 domain-containing protein [Planktothrix sp. GU0601_MAG3]
MKLTYRGHQYEASFSPIDVVESELTGKYRGRSVQFHYPRHVPVPQTPQPLKYRGVSYGNKEPGYPLHEVKAVAPNKSQSAETRGGALLHLAALERPLNENLAKVHANHLCRLLDRRRQAAVARGDLHLLHLLDLEAEHIAC